MPDKPYYLPSTKGTGFDIFRLDGGIDWALEESTAKHAVEIGTPEGWQAHLDSLTPEERTYVLTGRWSK
jgi:hypothetical protein